MRNHPLNRRLSDRAYDACEAMHSAAAVAFYACERFGKLSKQHNAASLDYYAAKEAYEAICAQDGIDPYVDPNQYFS